MCVLKSQKASFFKKVNLWSDKPLARETLHGLFDDAHSTLLPVQPNCSLCPQRSALLRPWWIPGTQQHRTYVKVAQVSKFSGSFVLHVLHFGGYSKTRHKKLVTHVESHASAVSLLSRERRIALYKSGQQQQHKSLFSQITNVWTRCPVRLFKVLQCLLFSSVALSTSWLLGFSDTACHSCCENVLHLQINQNLSP